MTGTDLLGASPALIGIASALLTVLAFAPYIRDTWRGETRPQRSTWFIWSVLSTIALISQIYEGAGASLWFAGAQVAGTIVICGLAIHRGFGAFLSGSDWLVLGLAGCGVVLWAITEDAAYALAITIAISLLGGSVTVLKAFREPDTETMSTWFISLFAALLGLAAVGSPDPLLLAYPLYLVTLYAMILGAQCLGLLVLRQRLLRDLQFAMDRHV